MKVGVHEAMDLHEKLSESVTMIDHFTMYIKQCNDGELRNILQKQQRHMIDSYNAKVNALQGKGINVTRTPRPVNMPAAPNVTGSVMQAGGSVNYGMQQTAPMTPQTDLNKLDDQIIANGALFFHKCGAQSSTRSALECADSNLRRLLLNSARDCTEMAYEIFQYMNRRGWYQVPAMPEQMFSQIQGSYSPATSNTLM